LGQLATFATASQPLHRRHLIRPPSLVFGAPSEQQVNHLMFEVDRIEDIGIAYDLVAQTGIPVIVEPGSHVDYQIYSFCVKNPSGFVDDIGWDDQQSTGQSEYYQRD
jgi:hypothetical protein